MQAIAPNAHHTARLGAAVLEGASPPETNGLALPERMGNGPGVVGANMASQFPGRRRPVDPPLGLGHPGRVGGPLRLLWRRAKLAAKDCRKMLKQQLRSHARQAIFQFAGGFLRADICLASGQQRPCIQARLHLHQRHPGSLVASPDRRRNGRCAAPARQQGSMDIDRAETAGLKRGRRKNSAIGGHHHQIRAAGAQGPN